MKASGPLLLTVTPNPALDRMLYVPQMTVGTVHRAAQVRQVAGGKGLNVARAARTLGGIVVATGLLAGHAGQLFADLADAEGLSTDWYWLTAGETRTCLLVNHARDDATVINEPGESMPAKDWPGFTTHISRLATEAQAVAFCGSLLPGVDPSAFNTLACSLATSERTVYLDTSVAALQAALAQPEGLCIKVNRAELAAGLKSPLTDLKQLVEAGQMLLARGAKMVVVTLGSDGALAIAPAGCWQVRPPPVDVVSTVGSGDSLLAGLAVARLAGRSIDEALALGVACGAANALTKLPGRFEQGVVDELLERVNVKKI
jgi:1-phosphofructokinase